ncbi:MAG: TonB-dependent receptor [Acidobacteria bacterium]|nr:TonB-dependent receptor [Acidobacteriota bacterium]
MFARVWNLLLPVIVAAPLLAQSTSTITGQVTDQSQAAVVGAEVVVRSVETGVEQRTITNQDGYYTVVSLLPVRYVVTAAVTGFKRTSSEEIKLDIGATVKINLMLVPADSKQTVEVRADAPEIETQSGAAATTVSGKEVNSLPLQGRNVLELALTVGGVMGEMGADEGGITINTPSTGAGLSIAGGRAGNSAFLADGSNATSVGMGRATVTFSPDTIQEFRVITNSFSAQYGVSGGGIVSTVSKSGTDQLHGSAYYFNRNPSLAARKFHASLPPGLRRHELGITMSGPVVLPKIYDGRRKTFFFASFEPKRYSDSSEVRARYPTAAERAGDFSDSYVAQGQTRPLLYRQVECYPSESDCRQLRPLQRATNTTVYPLFSAGDPDPRKVGLVIPKQYLDPIAQLILKDVPLPNIAPDSNGNNYFGKRGVNGVDNRWNVKIDHNLSSRNRLSGRYTSVPNKSNRWNIENQVYAFAIPSDWSVTRQVFVSDSHTVSPHIVNEFRGSYTYSDYSRTLPGDLANTNYTAGKFGLPSQTTWGYPQFDSGWGTYGANINANTLGLYTERQSQVSDDLTFILGKHNIMIGTDWRFPRLDSMGTGLNGVCCGYYNFVATATNSGNANTPGGAGGLTFASFLLGIPSYATLRGVVIPYEYHWRSGAAFFQDDFKVTRNFTLNLGLRWQYNSPRSEANNRQASIDIDNPVAILNAEGQVTSYTFNYLFTGFGRSKYLEPVHKKDFEPRFGFAWSPDFSWAKHRRMVVRGGYGISHAGNLARGRSAVPDFGGGSANSTYSYTQWVGTSATPPATLTADPMSLVTLGRNPPKVTPNPQILEIPSNGVLCAGCTPVDPRVPTGGSLYSFSKTNSSPYIQTWSLTTQIQMPHAMVLSVSYLGSKGTHLYSFLYDVNKPNQAQYEELLNSGGDPAERVPDPFGRVDGSGNPITVPRQDLMRPYPTAGPVQITGLTNSTSIYNAGTVELERRFRERIGFRFNYTWAKSIDTGSDGGLDVNLSSNYNWGRPIAQNPEDLAANRSVSQFDQRHRINLTMNAESPFQRSWLLRSWAVNVVGSLYSGFPFSPFLGATDSNGTTNSVTNSNQQRIRPDIVPGVPIYNPRWTREQANDVPYINPEAFARPAYGKLGNAARTLDWARSPIRPGLNVSLFREFHPFDNARRYVQLRGEFFNVLNHTSFSLSPNSSPALFSGTPPVSRTGLSLAGPLPYYSDKPPGYYPAGSREAVLATYYIQTFGKLDAGNNAPGRIIQLAIKLYW